MPREIRYARPVRCQGARQQNRLPPGSTRSFIKPLHNGYTMLIRSGFTCTVYALSVRLRLHPSQSRSQRSRKEPHLDLRIPSRVALADPGGSRHRIHALGALAPAQRNQTANRPALIESPLFFAPTRRFASLSWHPALRQACPLRRSNPPPAPPIREQ